MSSYPTDPGYVAGSETSKAAAKSIDATSLRQRVIGFILDRGLLGATDNEIEVNLGLLHQTASSRRRELVLSGKVIPTKRKRKTLSGRFATVWVHRLCASDEEIASHEASTQQPQSKEEVLAPHLDPNTEIWRALLESEAEIKEALRCAGRDSLYGINTHVERASKAVERCKVALRAARQQAIKEAP